MRIYVALQCIVLQFVIQGMWPLSFGAGNKIRPFFQLEQSSFPWQRKEIYYFPIKTIKFSLATKDLSGVE